VPGTSQSLSAAVVVAILLAVSFTSSARTYKWVDAQGITHYSQSKPLGRPAEELFLSAAPPATGEERDGCASLSCRAQRLTSERLARERAAEQVREKATRAAAAYPIFPTPVEETDAEKIARLLAECKSSRGSHCDSDEEMRRMLLQNVELTQAERRALRGLSPAVQRRVLEQRIPKRFRDID
jgi:Domain of unknown function (DUF4124)